MPVHLLDKSLNVDLLAIKVELFAILCAWLAIDPSNAAIRDNVLNFTRRELGSVEVRGRIVDVMVVPLARAFGGRNVRNKRAGFAQVENGLNLAETSVINFVIISATVAQRASNSVELTERGC
jgi:hypothetical protein